jgi:hypothetical protein
VGTGVGVDVGKGVDVGLGVADDSSIGVGLLVGVGEGRGVLVRLAADISDGATESGSGVGSVVHAVIIRSNRRPRLSIE